MCGLAGLLTLPSVLEKDKILSIVTKMAEALVHRGPDDSGCWADAGIGLGHRRLSIVDLSPEGHQPMLSACGRFVIAFNGEIYNHQEIRKELEANGSVAWRGHSDTEVMLAAISAWGLQVAVKRFVGMFAFALWDCQEKTLHLVRDRAGEKPLYYGWSDGAFLFASELKALRRFPGWTGEIDRNSLALYFRYNYVPAPFSIFKDFFKLIPGTILSLSMDDIDRHILPEAITYWSATDIYHAPSADTSITDHEAILQTDKLLSLSVKQQMIADVPLGAFLSGGIDSSLIVALMQKQSEKPVRTFTIGFDEEQYNEAEQARLVATHLGTDHTELYISPQQAMQVIPQLPFIYDEPFSDSSQIPTYLVSQLARKHVAVSLSGDAGDELFGGYNRYSWATSVWRRIGWIPNSSRKAMAGMITSVSPQSWDSVFDKMAYLLPAKLRQRTPGDKLHKLAGILAAQSPDALYKGLVSHWQNPCELVKDSVEPHAASHPEGTLANVADMAQQMMYLDLIGYLPDDILAKVDRAAMAVSLETRVPMLDHRLIEFSATLPLSMKIRHGQGKWLLRQVLYQYVPQKLIERPKMGFGIPLDAWLRGPLRDWAENLLRTDRLEQEGFLNPAPIREKWQEHLSGKRNWQYLLWDVLMFESWLDAQKVSMH